MEFISVEAITQLGFSVAVCAFLIVHSQKEKKQYQAMIENLVQNERNSSQIREARFIQHVEEMQEFQKQTLLKLVVDGTTAIQNNTAALKELRRVADAGSSG